MWIQGLVWRYEGNIPTNKKRNGWLVGLDGWKAWRNGENSMDCGHVFGCDDCQDGKHW